MDGSRELARHKGSEPILKYERIMKATSSVPVGIVVTAAVMLVLAFIVNVFNVPNPNMILISGLVICSALFGYVGGLVGGLVMGVYTLFFFSTGNDFVTFTDQNLQKVIVSAIGVIVVAFFVSALRFIIARTFNEFLRINELLEEDNRLLEEASAIDSLTNTRNRFALRHDFPDYVDKNLHVMMLDLDNFKDLNDTFGHNVGDYVLNQMGRALIDLWSRDHVYRYGGDEFLVICPCETEEAFARKAGELKEHVAAIEVEGLSGSVQFSAGYVFGVPSIQGDLRLMIRQADLNLYVSKDAGKNQVIGTAFSRAIAETMDPHQKDAHGHFDVTIRAGR